MKKIISLFQRNYDGDRLVRDEVVPGAEWVLNGEGLPTRKWDGTCCMVRDGKLFKRHDRKMKKNKHKAAPQGWEPAQDPDKNTGHWPGWCPVGQGPEDRWHREAFELWCRCIGEGLYNKAFDGTYELCGPKVQGNPEQLDRHDLITHGGHPLTAHPVPPRTFSGLREWFRGRDIEGIVWHHPDGRMVKIKAKDFGIKRGGGE